MVRRETETCTYTYLKTQAGPKKKNPNFAPSDFMEFKRCSPLRTLRRCEKVCTLRVVRYSIKARLRNYIGAKEFVSIIHCY